MNSPDTKELLRLLTTTLDDHQPHDWQDIIDLLDQVKRVEKPALISQSEDILKVFSRGAAFLTFSYGIDGVSIEIAKYAQILENLFTPSGKSSIHFIGESFQPEVSSIIKPEWHRLQLEGIDGWGKWDDGRWFNALFKQEMRSLSSESNLLTREVYRQAVSIAKRLGRYFIDNDISLVFPVNIVSNPGNIALTLALVLAAEILGLYVLNSNHDFFWEGGKPLSERAPGEEPGVRDHFFRNMDNKTFFSLFEMLYPWNGSRWLQVNINALQSAKLIETYNFPQEKVSEISTCLDDNFFEPYTWKDVVYSRLRMGHILSDGEATLHPHSIADHLSTIDQWMEKQKPIILGSRPGLSVDPGSEHLSLLLQPTRLVSRKRIERDLELISALFQKSPLKDDFENNPHRKLILHITGPTPKEHQEDLERVLHAYQKTISTLPKNIADRIFLSFSVGREDHASFSEKGFTPLTIENIYRMADLILFPSQTEGRGLPIIESSAIGIPIVCSQYEPVEVFNDVVGESLPEESRIQYTLFPEGEFPQDFLSEVAGLIINPGAGKERISHNKKAVHARYSTASLQNKFDHLLNQLGGLD